MKEMTGRAHSQIFGGGRDGHAAREDFLRVFHEDLNGLYQLAFLLTRNHQKAEKCFLSSIDHCAKHNGVFKEWARTWAKRVIVENAIRELKPRPIHPHSPSFPRGSSHNPAPSGSIGHFDVDSILDLPDFERFVFALCILEHYREHDCAVLLGCGASAIRRARTWAIVELANIGHVDPVMLVS
jgi:hypothetical protein